MCSFPMRHKFMLLKFPFIKQSRTGILAGCFVLLLGMLPLNSEARKFGFVSDLEQQLLGQKYSNQPLSIRIQRLEQHLSVKSGKKQSNDYRLARLSQTQGSAVSSQRRQVAVEAYNRGVELEKQEHAAQAMQAYRQAIQADPTLVQPYNNLANLLMKNGQYDETVALYKRALEQDPKNPVLHRNLGLLYEKLGKIEAAVGEYQQYLKHTTQPDPPIRDMVETYQASRKTGLSAPDYLSAITHASQGQPLIWQRDTLPVQVFIQVGNAEQMAVLPVIQRSLSTWEKVTDYRLKFKLARWADTANIVIKLQEGPLSDPYANIGHAEFQMPEEQLNQHRMSFVTVTLNTGLKDSDKNIPLECRNEQIYRMALHEIGHAIGIWGHSPDPGDIMFTHPIATDLSDRDIRTVRKLYGL